MVKQKRSSYGYHFNFRSSSSSILKFFPKKPSFFTVTLYIVILLFSSSVLIFLFSSRNIVNDDHDFDEQKHIFTQYDQSQSLSESQSQPLQVNCAVLVCGWLIFCLEMCFLVEYAEFALWEMDCWVSISISVLAGNFCFLCCFCLWVMLSLCFGCVVLMAGLCSCWCYK